MKLRWAATLIIFLLIAGFLAYLSIERYNSFMEETRTLGEERRLKLQQKIKTRVNSITTTATTTTTVNMCDVVDAVYGENREVDMKDGKFCYYTEEKSALCISRYCP